METADAQRLSLPDVSLCYWTAGEASRPCVIFTHGATADHRMFASQVEALAADYYVVTYDARGHGESRPVRRPFTLLDCARDVVALLDALRVDRAVLVGQSMGGIVHQYTYLHEPERVQAMAAIGSVCIAFPYRWSEVTALKLTMPLFRLWPYGHFTGTVARQVSHKPATQAYMRDAIGQLRREEFLQIWEAVSLAINTTGVPGHHIRVPLLIAHGDRDDYGTIRRDAPRWAGYEPDVEYVVIPDAGHNANQDNPGFTNTLLARFLERVTTQSHPN